MKRSRPLFRRQITRLILAVLVVTISAVLFVGVPVHAQQTNPIVINPEFEYVRQGSFGIISLSGGDLIGATVSVIGHTYPFFPTSKGFAAFIAVPMEQQIKDYPMSVTLTARDGKTAKWDSTLKVAAGEFIVETPYALPGEKLYLLSEKIQDSEDQRLEQTFSMITPAKFWEGPFSMPVMAPATAPFGSWRIFNGDTRRRHTGQDFKVTAGVPVMAAANGRVVLSRPLDIHGESVVIDHGWGIYTEYSHFSARYVVPGQFVLQGDILGLTGSTGRSTGPHLHWEVAVNGVWVSPMRFLQVKLPN